MASRKEYFHNYYVEHKLEMNLNAYRWFDKKREELGEAGFKKWKSEQHKKWIAKKTRELGGVAQLKKWRSEINKKYKGLYKIRKILAA